MLMGPVRIWLLHSVELFLILESRRRQMIPVTLPSLLNVQILTLGCWHTCVRTQSRGAGWSPGAATPPIQESGNGLNPVTEFCNRLKSLTSLSPAFSSGNEGYPSQFWLPPRVILEIHFEQIIKAHTPESCFQCWRGPSSTPWSWAGDSSSVGLVLQNEGYRVFTFCLETVETWRFRNSGSEEHRLGQ